MLGNNMFTYCLNNPVVYSDEAGSTAKACLTADSTIADAPWRDHSPGGGGIVYYCTTQYDGESRTQRFLREVLNGIKKGAKWAWDTYSQETIKQQYAQIRDTQLMVDSAISIYAYLDETGAISVAKWGTNTVNAARHGKIAMGYLVAPIPTPIDEYLAACHAAKAIYHLFMAGMEVFQ